MRISEAAHILSIPRHKINYWKSTGLLNSSTEGLGFEDLKRIRLLEKWRTSGLTLQRIRKMLQSQAFRAGEEPGQALLQLELLDGPLLGVREDTALLDPVQGQGLLDFTGPDTGQVVELEPRKSSNTPEDWSAQDDEILRLLEARLAEEEKGLETGPPGPEWGSPEEGARLFEAIRQSDPERAMSTLEAIVQDRPDYLPARIELGNLFFETGDLESASTAYESALELDADCVEALYNLANVYYRMEKFAASIRLFQRSIDLDPSFPESYYNLALVYFSLKYFRESEELFESYLEMDSDSPFAENARDFLQEIREIGSEQTAPGLFDDWNGN
ncbi:MAG: tetratricopeptide repeat protein [Leptospiraceae bacterium]